MLTQILFYAILFGMKQYDFPHSIRFTSQNREILGEIKKRFPTPISAAGLVNYILTNYGIPRYKRESKLPQIRPFTRRNNH